MFRGIINISTGLLNGILEINVSQDILANLFTQTSADSRRELFIVNSKGTIILTGDKKDLYSNIANQQYFQWAVDQNRNGTILQIGKEKFLVTSSKFERMDWIIIGLIPIEELMQDNN